MHPEKEKILKKLTEREIQDRLYGKIRGLGERISAINIQRKYEPDSDQHAQNLSLVKAQLQKVKAAQDKSFYRLKRRDRTIDFNWKVIAFTGICLIGLSAIITSLLLIKPAAKHYMSPPQQRNEAQITKKESKPYTIQVAVYDKRDMASVLTESLKNEGLDAYIAESVSSSGNRRYKVYVGQFGHSNEPLALQILDKIKSKDQFRDAFIRYK